MFTLNIGIVVVRNAEKPTTSGLCSLIASMNVSGAICTPRSMTSKPAPSSMMSTRFLPMSCTSPLTVPIRNIPMVSAPVSPSRGRRSRARRSWRVQRSASPGRRSRRARSARRPPRAPGSAPRRASSPGPSPSSSPLFGELQDRGLVADERLIVEAAEDLVMGHAVPFLHACGYEDGRRARGGLATICAASPSRRSRDVRTVGAETEIAAMTVPRARGPARPTEQRPASSSSHVVA